jgi:hypothetical protein
MKIVSPVLFGLSLAVAGSSFTAAQETAPLPKVLQVTREFVKPGKAGALHDRSESNFVQALARAKWPTHYIAYQSLSGKSRALYISFYDSFEALQKDNDAMDKNAALAAELDRLTVADGELLDSTDQFVFTRDEDLALRPLSDLSGIRYLDVTSFHIRPGHGHEFEDLAKMVIGIHKKAGTSAHWATFELEYGGGDEYVLLSGKHAMSEIDDDFADGKKFRDAAGEDAMKKIRDMAASCIESTDSELFSVNPRQSYPPDEWVKADPGFWKPKPEAAPAAKLAAPAKKPAQ